MYLVNARLLESSVLLFIAVSLIQNHNEHLNSKNMWHAFSRI